MSWGLRIFRVFWVGLAVAAVFSGLGGHATRLGAQAEAQPSQKSKTKTGKTKTSPCAGRNLLDLIQAKDPEAAARAVPEPSDARNDGAVLYEITKDGLAPSYLFGTVHLTDPRVTKLSKNVTKALSSSKILALEVAELSPKATAAAVARSTDLVLFNDGRTLDGLLSAKEFELVVDRLEASDTPRHLARQFKPWVVSMILTVSKCEGQKIAKGGLVLDMKLAEQARKSAIPVVGLETIEHQLELASKVPLDDQLQLLRASIVYAERSNDLMETVLQLYLRRQLSYAVPLQIVLAEKAGIDGTILRSFRREQIEQRNQRMAERALKLLEAGGAFVAVGALHLPGENGLVALFRRAGFTVLAIE